MSVVEVISQSLEQTAELAGALAEVLKPGDIVLLEGELGAGKTTLIREIVSALGVDMATVSSPTFVLANEYDAADGLTVVHIDAYRLAGDDDEELALLGWDRLTTEDTVVLIEWADRIAGLIDRPSVRVMLEHVAESSRVIRLELPDGQTRWADLAQHLSVS
jgi:tRNA threonylcarbamoyladenosine biosynthesis protein TsaE